MLFAFNFSGSPVIYFYNDGFIVGKDKEKILYKNFEYYYTPGLSEGNIYRICYKTEKNECKSLSLQGLGKGTRKILIKDYLNYIIAEKINRVEEGYEEKFVVKRDIKSIFELMIGILSFFVIIGPAVDKIFSDCPGNIYENSSGTYEILFAKDYIKIKDVIYNRNENKMFFNKWNNFIISDLEGKILQQIYFNNITRPDLFLNLINHFFTEKEDLQQ